MNRKETSCFSSCISGRDEAACGHRAAGAGGQDNSPLSGAAGRTMKLLLRIRHREAPPRRSSVGRGDTADTDLRSFWVMCRGGENKVKVKTKLKSACFGREVRAEERLLRVRRYQGLTLLSADRNSLVTTQSRAGIYMSRLGIYQN